MYCWFRCSFMDFTGNSRSGSCNQYILFCGNGVGADTFYAEKNRSFVSEKEFSAEQTNNKIYSEYRHVAIQYADPSSLVIVLLNIALIKQGGDLAVGALGIQKQHCYVVSNAVIGLNQGIQPILGYNYGARNYDRMFSALKTAASDCHFSYHRWISALYLVSACIGRHFTTDEELKQNCCQCPQDLCYYVSVNWFLRSFYHFFQSIGKAKISMLLSLTRQVAVLIPAVLVLLPSFSGLNGVWASHFVADFWQ